MKIKVGTLIEKIGPLNNICRSSNVHPVKKIVTMWEVGDILFKAGIKNIHPIAWEIDRKSYITRDFLSYCYRIRGHWKSKEDLRKDFPNLKSYIVFREALPLIENEKFRLEGEKLKDLLNLVNKERSTLALRKIKELKKSIIGFKNPRTQRIGEVSEHVKVFNEIRKELLESLEDDERIKKIRNSLGEEGLLNLSKVCLALSQEGFPYPEKISMREWPEKYKKFGEVLYDLVNKDKDFRNRFRRFVKGFNLTELSDIFNSIITDHGLKNLRQRMKLKIHV